MESVELGSSGRVHDEEQLGIEVPETAHQISSGMFLNRKNSEASSVFFVFPPMNEWSFSKKIVFFWAWASCRAQVP